MVGVNQALLGLDPLHKKTRKEVLLEEMSRVVTWAGWVAVIQPHAPGAQQALGGRSPFPVETMLRMAQLSQHKVEVIVALGRAGKRQSEIDADKYPHTAAMAAKLQTQEW